MLIDLLPFIILSELNKLPRLKPEKTEEYSNLDGTGTVCVTHNNQIVFFLHCKMFHKSGIQNRQSLYLWGKYEGDYVDLHMYINGYILYYIVWREKKYA